MSSPSGRGSLVEPMEIGIDAVEVGRIKSVYERHGERFLTRVFTPAEIEYAFSARGDRRFERLAGRFALKEALIKAWGEGIPFSAIEVRNDPAGRPLIACPLVSGKIKASLTHTRKLAIGCVLFVD